MTNSDADNRKLTRRELLGLSGRGVESADTDSADASNETDIQGSGPVLVPPKSFIIRASLVLLLLCASVVGSGAAEASMVSPEEATEQRSLALDRLAELERLNSDPMVSVDQSTIETVSARIEQGNISYTRANYDNASDHWQIAREQARAALIRHYNLGADRYLNTTSDYLDAREAAGYNSVEMSQFRQQAQQIRAENASGLQESRDRYEAAQNLNSTVESELPPMDAVQLANHLTPLPMSAAVVAGALLALLSIVGYFGYLRGKGQTPESGGGGGGGGTGTTETGSTLR